MKVNPVQNYNNSPKSATNFTGMRRFVSSEILCNLQKLENLRIEELKENMALDALDMLEKEKKLNFIEVTKNIIIENASVFSNSHGVIDIGLMIENFKNIFNVKHFLKATKEVGDVVLLKRDIDAPVRSYNPIDVKLIKTEIVNPAEPVPNVFFSFFEKEYESSSNNDDLDKSELGLMETKVFDLNNLVMPFEHDKSSDAKSLRALKRVYNVEKVKALEILHILSYEGFKYKGIGSKLIDLAIQYSKNLGLDGRIFLYAENSHTPPYYKSSRYCESRYGESPTRFYYKYGFRADTGTNKLLANGCDDYGFTMYLPQSVIKKKADVVQNPKFD